VRLRAFAFLALAACGNADAPREPKANALAASKAAEVPDTAGVMAELRRIASESGGTVGVAAIHVETGQRLALNARQPYPMASTFKLPLGLAILARVDSGRISLDDSLDVTPADFRLPPNPIVDSVGPAGGRATVRALLRSMLVDSDNAAADRLLRVVGGPAVATEHLRSRGIQGIRIDRSEGQVSWDYNGVNDVPPPAQWSLAEFERRTSAVAASEREAARARFWADPRDTAAPEAFAALLVQVQKGEGLSAESRRLVLDAMERSPRGRNRIRAGVPEGTTVGDRTGTIGRSTNDIGLITLPDGSHVALAVMVKMSTRTTEDEERTIARVARAVYDHFARQAKS
jgi:beta-lactamase class A